MGLYGCLGFLLVLMHPYVFLWVLIGPYRSLLVVMRPCVFLWVLINPNASLSVCMGLYGSL